MFAKYFVVLCLFSTADASLIDIDPGFEIEKIQWPEFINRPRTEVQRELSKIFPNVKFTVLHVARRIITDDLYPERIKIVIDDRDIVVEVPSFFGQKPNFTFFEKLLGKKWYVAMYELTKALPTAAVVVEQNGRRISSYNQGGNYVLIFADLDDIVRKMPKYVRVPIS